MSSSALYVYAVVPADAPAEVSEVAGIEGRAVRVVAGAGGIAAVVHEGDPIPYQGADEDVKGWILEHSRVVEHAWEKSGSVLPVTFNVLVRADAEDGAEARLRRWLDDEAVIMSELLERLRGRVELRVEIVVERAAAVAGDPEVRERRAELASRPAGLRRLLEKKLEQLERSAADDLADRLYPEIRRRIAAHAEELTEQRRARAPAGTALVISAAVLVRGSAVEALGAELARLQEEEPALRIRFLGPWPPYSFAQAASTGPEASNELTEP